MKYFITLQTIYPNLFMTKFCIFFFLGLSLCLSAQPASLKVAANGHFLEQVDGKPFFYLGDTAWELFHRLNREEVVHYLDIRQQQGMNVVQAVALAELEGIRTPNTYGDYPLLDEDPTKLAITPGNDPAKPSEYDYWDHVDFVVQKAAEKGIYIAFLPTWGDKVVQFWGVGPVIFNVENARKYGAILSERYGNRTNIIWMLGGDRPAIGEEDKVKFDHVAIWRAMAEGLKSKSTVPQLMTYHTSGGDFTTSRFLPNEPWLDMHSMQSSHGDRDIKVWDWIARDWALQPAKPTFDSEPCYEDHPVNPWKPGWTEQDRGYFREYDVRKQSYRSVFAGGFGITYGHHCIWQFYDGKFPLISYPDPKGAFRWRAALQRPAAWQMQHLKNLMLSKPFVTRIPANDLIVDNPDDPAKHTTATCDKNGTWAMIYTPIQQPLTVDLDKLRGKKLKVSWFDPRDGSRQVLKPIIRKGKHVFQPPVGGDDWVLILER
jgi:Protein of unknown function (DUF4038)/Putative collagen-binding domain of a collagenase